MVATLTALAFPAGAQSRPTSVTRSLALSPLIAKVMAQMAHLQLTTVPLEAPVGPLQPVLWPAGNQLGAWFQAKPSAYTVTMGICPPSPPPAVHTVAAPPCTGDGADISATVGYAAVAHPSRAAALAVLQLSSPVGSSVRVDLGRGLSGTEYRSGGWVVDWTSGSWHFRVDQSHCGPQNSSGALPLAKEMASFASIYPLPKAPGSVVMTSYCGDSTSVGTVVTWAQGADVYFSYQFDSYSKAMFLASQMRPYV